VVVAASCHFAANRRTLNGEDIAFNTIDVRQDQNYKQKKDLFPGPFNVKVLLEFCAI